MSVFPSFLDEKPLLQNTKFIHYTRAANASDFIVNLPVLWPSLRLYDCNGKSTIFMLANYLTYTLYVTLTLPITCLRFPPLYKDFINIDTRDVPGSIFYRVLSSGY